MVSLRDVSEWLIWDDAREGNSKCCMSGDFDGGGVMVKGDLGGSSDCVR